MLRYMRSLLLGLAVLAAAFVPALAQNTLKAAKDRGYLLCGVSQGLPGFSNSDAKGNASTSISARRWLRPRSAAPTR